MDELQIFNYEGAQIRTIQKKGETWWVLKDVCEALNMDTSQISKVAVRVDDDEKGRNSITTPGGDQVVWTVNESGLYSIILRSDKPEAKPFRKWITSEVLPTIRRTGGYVSNDDLFIDTYFTNMDEAAKIAFKQTLQSLRTANAKIEQDKPKVTFAEAITASKTSILVGELAKLLRQNGIETGERRLFAWLREHGYLIRRKGSDYNMPTQRSVERGLFEVKESAITHNSGSVSIQRTTKVTGKGQEYFVNQFLSGKAEKKTS